MLQKLREGTFRGLAMESELANAYALQAESNQSMYENDLLTGLIADEAREGWKLYWLGTDPKAASDPDQTLIAFLHQEETDEVDAFRTTRRMMEEKQELVDISLYLFRDAAADRREEELYDIVFFDTPQGEQSLFKVITSVPEVMENQLPRPLRVILRGITEEGAAWPVYSLTDHFYAMCDGTAGRVSVFDGAYQATFDSDYLRIEGILDNRLNITIKKGQPIWAEWTGADTAEDLNGDCYVLVDGTWYLENEVPAAEDSAEAA